VDLALWLAGAPPVEVVAFAENAGLPVECFMNVQARLADGVLLPVTSADAVPQSLSAADRSVTIVGDEGATNDDVPDRCGFTGTRKVIRSKQRCQIRRWRRGSFQP
jgi:hypothetical protein